MKRCPHVERRAAAPPLNTCSGLGLLVVVLAVSGACGAGNPADRVPQRRQLLIVLDGLRPDYVRPDLMPALHALGQRGVVMTRHHAVFPTVTRVNAASISTGAYPETHGLIGNSMYDPAVDASRFLSTSDRDNLRQMEAAANGQLLSATTLGEVLEASGDRMLVASAGSSGSAYLLNHRASGAILHYDYGVPASLHDRAVDELGPVPSEGIPNHARNRWIVDAFLTVGLVETTPAVMVVWLSDPDTTAHRHGIGHPLTGEALFRLDAEIQRLQDGLAAAGLLDSTNIWVTSDHGFSTHTGGVDVPALLEPFAGTLEDGSPRIVEGAGAIYVRDDDETTVASIVAALQRTDGVGAVFTRAARPGAREGRVPGTLSLDVARWHHARSAPILFSPDWTDRVGAAAYPGTAAAEGVAGHGSSSPFDIHNTLLAAGPDLKSGIEITVPTGNVDFAPTFLHLLGLEIPPSMQGRVLHEALQAGPDPAAADVETSEVTVETEDGAYRLTAVMSGIGGVTYLDYTTVERR